MSFSSSRRFCERPGGQLQQSPREYWYRENFKRASPSAKCMHLSARREKERARNRSRTFYRQILTRLISVLDGCIIDVAVIEGPTVKLLTAIAIMETAQPRPKSDGKVLRYKLRTWGIVVCARGVLTDNDNLIVALIAVNVNCNDGVNDKSGLST